jgi:hypothetical protein
LQVFCGIQNLSLGTTNFVDFPLDQ